MEEYFTGLSESVNIEKEVINRLLSQKLITTHLTDLEKVVVALSCSTEYTQQHMSDIIGLSHTTLWNIYRVAIGKMRSVIEEERG